jgi:phthalate 4,5-cis-dihydrodiol dehydrogenase
MLKAARNDGGADCAPAPASPTHHQHFGPLLVYCDRADLRQTPRDVMVYGDAARTFRALPDPLVPRVEVIDELEAAVVDGVRPQHDAEGSRATIEACLALLESSPSGRDIPLRLQVPTRDRNMP